MLNLASGNQVWEGFLIPVGERGISETSREFYRNDRIYCKDSACTAVVNKWNMLVYISKGEGRLK